MEKITYESVLELITENSKQIKVLKESITTTFAEAAAESARSEARSEKEFKKVQKQLAEFGDTLGKYAEEQVKSALIKKFNIWGIPVHAMTTHFVKNGLDDDFLYEVDILIYNTDYIVAIEVKNQLKKDDIDNHLLRMEKLQSYPLPASEGKILLGGMAAMIIGNGLEKYTHSRGLFLIKPSGESVKITNNKKTFKPKEWPVAV